MRMCLRTMKASRSASPIMAGLLLLTACSQQQMSATSAEEQREKAACAQVRQQQPELVQRFVDLWVPPLLEVDFQRQFTTDTELPARYDPAQFGDLTETEELGLASCLADELAALQPEPPPNAPSFTIVGGGGRNVYENSFITESGSPLYGGALDAFIFDRDEVNLADPSQLPPTVEPLPPITFPPGPTPPDLE